MRKTKVLLILFLIVFSIIPFSKTSAHSVELDPDSLISFPMTIWDGKGTITIWRAEEGYSLYYQSVEMKDADYEQIKKIREDGEKELDEIETKLDSLEAEYQNLETIYDKAVEEYKEKKEAGATEEELETYKTAYETAKTNYQNKIAEYNDKVDEYNNKVIEINTGMRNLTPSYEENKWTQTSDGDFAVDLTQFSGEKAFVIWVKLVTVDGKIIYDEQIYSMSGTKEEEVGVQSIKLDKSSVTITKGSSYTLNATISPSNATNKTIIWTSDNEKVATVSDGKITAISVGTATIKATTADGGFEAICEVTVTEETTKEPEEEKDKPTEDSREEPKNEEKDETVAQEKIPNAGKSYIIFAISSVALMIVGVVMYKKVKYLNF